MRLQHACRLCGCERRCSALILSVPTSMCFSLQDVDLIVCFDAQQSSTRLVQRMGRCGRKRKVGVVVPACLLFQTCASLAFPPLAGTA